MQRLAIVVFVCVGFCTSSCLQEDFPVLYDTYVDILVKDRQGNNLLDPAVDGHFDHAALKLYYVRNSDTVEVFFARQDAPRNLSVLKNESNNEFFLRILPDEGRVNEEETLTLLEWAPGLRDNVTCLFGRNEQAVFIQKVWYNNELRFDIESSPTINWGEAIMGRFIVVEKSN
jgi:hypothetical protein